MTWQEGAEVVRAAVQEIVIAYEQRRYGDLIVIARRAWGEK